MANRFARWLPLTGMVALLTLTLAVTAVVRAATAGQGFFVQRESAVITLAVGVAVSAFVTALACRRVLRQGASADLWALRLTALAILLPVVLAVVLPQSPAR